MKFLFHVWNETLALSYTVLWSVTSTVTMVTDAQPELRSISQPPKKWAALIGQATAGAGLFSKHGGQRKNVKSCTAALQICAQGKVHVFLFTGEIFFSFLPFRLCVEGSSSSPVCCLAKLTNTCSNENNIIQSTKHAALYGTTGGDRQGAPCQFLF